MVIKSTPGRPFREFPGGVDRSKPTPGEVRAAAAQSASLNRDPDKIRRQVIASNKLLIGRRNPDVREGLLSPTDAKLDQIIDETNQPLQVINEILVRTDDLLGKGTRFRPTPMRDVLSAHGLSESPVPELQDRVTRLGSATKSATELADIAADLRAAGYQASMNQVLPLGYVTKCVPGGIGPEPAERDIRPAYPGALRPEGLSDVIVAVIDTGITDQVRPDDWLTDITAAPADVDPLYEFDRRSNGASSVFDFCAGHGTFVAGVVQQVAPFSTIIVRRAIGQDGIGGDVDVAIAMWEAVVRHGATILNLSLGSEMAGDAPPVATMVALEMIAETQRDVVVVAAAGNSRSTRPVFPAAFSGMPAVTVPVVSVAGLTMSYEPAAFSTHGFWVTCSTAAECVLSTFAAGTETTLMDPSPDTWALPDPWAVWTGTSFAAPQVAGAIARRCQESADGPTAALAWVLSQGVAVPDYGKALEILPVS